MFSRFFQRIGVLILIAIQVAGTAAWWWIAGNEVESDLKYLWLTGYSILSAVVLIKVTKRIWPKKPRP